MPYVFVRENAIKYWCTVQGLSHNEVRVLAEKVQDQPEAHDDKAKKAEFRYLPPIGFVVSYQNILLIDDYLKFKHKLVPF